MVLAPVASYQTQPSKPPPLPCVNDLQPGPLRTTYLDLALTVGWHDLRPLVLPGTQWTILIGHKRRSDPLRAVLPLPLHTTALIPSELKKIFASLSALPLFSVPDPIPPLIPTIDELKTRLRKPTLPASPDRASATTTDKDSVEISGAPLGVASGTDELDLNDELDRELIYVAIVTSDSTVVYYKLAKGIRKPADIPDE